MISLTGCTKERIVYVEPVKIPINLIQDCKPPLPPLKMTFGDSIIYNEQLLNVIELCNKDKKAIREINKTE